MEMEKSEGHGKIRLNFFSSLQSQLIQNFFKGWKYFFFCMYADFWLARLEGLLYYAYR